MKTAAFTIAMILLAHGPALASAGAKADEMAESIAIMEWTRDNCAAPIPRLVILAAMLGRSDTTEELIAKSKASLAKAASQKPREEVCAVMIQALAETEKETRALLAQ